MFGTSFGEYLYRGIALLLAITVHEYAHGLMAVRLGDPTPKLYGRLTLNPLAHLDPIGAVMLLVFKFGWAKPVPVNARYFRNPRKGMFLVGLAGPLTNMVVAYILAMLFRVLFPFVWLSRIAYVFQLIFLTCIQYNLLLAAFNMIPVPPLDGSKILWGLLPPEYDRYIIGLERYGYAILMLLVLTGFTRYLIVPIYSVIVSPVDLIFSTF